MNIILYLKSLSYELQRDITPRPDKQTLKIIRCLIVGLSFMCMTSIIGMGLREAHQFFFVLFIIGIFSLLLRNIWITLFLCWTGFLYTFFRFQIGHAYLINIFLGCVLYYLTKISFKREHITFFLNGVLWLIAINLMYMSIQMLGYDFIFSGQNTSGGTTRILENLRPLGFMGNMSYTAILIAFGIPILASRRKWWLALLLFIPLWRLHCSTVALAALIGLLFILFFKVSRKVWIVCIVLCVLAGSLYLWKSDMPGTERFSQWKLTLRDAKVHPITGWGLDSFRNVTPIKKHLYVISPVYDKNNNIVTASQWDNPHNLYISLFFEWGVIGLFILGGYLRQLGIWFNRSVKEPNTLALAGVGLTVLLVSMGHFPMFLARHCVLAIPIFAMLENQTRA